MLKASRCWALRLVLGHRGSFSVRGTSLGLSHVIGSRNVIGLSHAIELPDFPRPPCRSSCRAVIGAPFFATKIRFLAFQTPHWRAFFDTGITFCTVKTQPLRPMLPIINPFNIQRDSFSTPHSTFSTLHIINPSPPAKRSASICRAGGVICVIDKQSEWHLCRSARSVGEIFSCRMAHSTSHTPHSQHPSPKSTLFFLSRPALRPNTPFSHIFVTV